MVFFKRSGACGSRLQESDRTGNARPFFTRPAWQVGVKGLRAVPAPTAPAWLDGLNMHVYASNSVMECSKGLQAMLNGWLMMTCQTVPVGARSAQWHFGLKRECAMHPSARPFNPRHPWGWISETIGRCGHPTNRVHVGLGRGNQDSNCPKWRQPPHCTPARSVPRSRGFCSRPAWLCCQLNTEC